MLLNDVFLLLVKVNEICVCLCVFTDATMVTTHNGRNYYLHLNSYLFTHIFLTDVQHVNTTHVIPPWHSTLTYISLLGLTLLKVTKV